MILSTQSIRTIDNKEQEQEQGIKKHKVLNFLPFYNGELQGKKRGQIMDGIDRGIMQTMNFKKLPDYDFSQIVDHIKGLPSYFDFIYEQSDAQIFFTYKRHQDLQSQDLKMPGKVMFRKLECAKKE